MWWLLWEIRWSFFCTSVFTLNADTNEIGSVLLFMTNIVMFVKKVKSALGKYLTKFLPNQMRQTGINHWCVVRKISWSKARNQLGTPGWVKSFLGGSKFLNYVQFFQTMSNTFSRGEKEIVGVWFPPSYGPAWGIGDFFHVFLCCFRRKADN